MNIAELIAKILVLIGFILAVFNFIGIIQLAPEFDRYGIHSFAFGGHPSNAASIFAIVTSILLEDTSKNKKFIMLSLIIEILTFRFKAIAFSVFVVYMLFFSKMSVIKTRYKIPTWIKIIPIIMILLFVCGDQIQFYFLNPQASRARALIASFKIAKDFFPFGSGFASFGTLMSGEYYSYAYIKYGLSQVWGFMNGEGLYSFIGDGGFATIIAQFGCIGLIVVLCSLYVVYKSAKQQNKEMEHRNILTYAILGYLIISQSNEGALNAENAVLFALVLAIHVKKCIFANKSKEFNGSMVNGKI